VNVEKIKYLITSRNAEEEGNRNITINKETIEKVNKFKYLGAYITSRNEVAEEIKSRFVSGNAFLFGSKASSLAINI
jgi:threonine dehydratase